MQRTRAQVHRLLPLSLVTLLLGTSGCGAFERSAACGKVAESFVVPSPKKRRTARTEDLIKVAADFRDAAKRLTAVGALPKDIAPIAGGLAAELNVFATGLEGAAQAKKKSRAPEYAAARLQAEEARQKLTDLARLFGEVCHK
jgi:hypothetical protein